MCDSISRSVFASSISLPLAIALALLSASSAPAQSSQSARESRRIDAEMRQRMLLELERLKRPARERGAATRPDYRSVEEDFEQLQVGSYELAGEAARAGAANYEQMRKRAGEIRKRASRLKVYLALPRAEQPSGPDKTALTKNDLTSAVASLDALVKSFVWNPVFSHPDVVDVEQSTKASRDLVGIIDLSGRIEKCAEGLGRRAP